MVPGWLNSPAAVYCLVATLALARAVTLSSQQPQQQQQQTQGLVIGGESSKNVTHHSSQQRHQQHQRQSPNLTGRQDAPRRNTSARQLSARIETLDDVAHRLDQSRPEVPAEQPADDTRVPFWNLAHMINSIEQVDLALAAGANGIETDISFDSSGRPVEAYHGFPCDCGRHCHHREEFVTFVRHLARLTVPPAPPSRLYLVLLDLKLKDLKSARQKELAGALLAEVLHKNLYAVYEQRTNLRTRAALEQNLGVAPPLRVIISINHAHDLPLTRAFLAYMHKNDPNQFMSQFIGWDVGMNDPLANITAAWDSLGATLGGGGGGNQKAPINIWQGDGLTNCANIVRGVERLKEAISVRNNQGHFRKVYYWTADVLYHIRAVLRLGLDAVLTNQPQRVLQALGEPEFRHKYRLATAYDDPFEQFWIRPTAWGMSLPSVGEINETVANIHKTGENFIKTIPDGVAAALKKVQSSIG